MAVVAAARAESYNDRATGSPPPAAPSGHLEPSGGITPGVDRAPEGPQTPSLDRRTKLGIGLTVYTTAGEALLYRRVPQGDSGEWREELPDGSARALVELEEREAENAARASRRAKGQVRRYAIANDCTRLWTLTCRDQTASRAVLLSRLQTFTKRLNRAAPGVAWVWVIERHKSGMLHAHLGLGAYVHYRVLRRLWGHGHVWANLIRAGEATSARRAARYLTKYITKDPVAGAGQHRYEVRQGFQPEAVRLSADTFDEAWRLAVGMMGGELPSYEWESRECQDWTGPPIAFLAW